MSNDLTADRAATGSPIDPTASPARVKLVATALAAGAATVTVLLLWRPGPDRNDLTYEAISPVRGAAWAATTADLVGFAVTAIGSALAVCLLVRRRGAAFATVGAALTALGGVLFASGVFAFGVLSWYATAEAALPPQTGADLLRYFEANPGPIQGPQAAGFLMYNVGSLLIATALWRGRSTHRWVPITLAVLTLAQFAPIPGRVLDLVQAVLMVTLVVVAGYVWRVARDPR